MNRIFIPNFQACNKAVIEFSRKEKINVRTSDKFYLANPNFASTPWPFAGLPVTYVCYDKQGKALYAGMSKNSSGQNNFIKVDSVTGEGVAKVPWPMGKPHHLVFYCLSDHALDGDDKLYRQMLELRRCLRKTIKECTTTPNLVFRSATVETGLRFRYMPPSDVDKSPTDKQTGVLAQPVVR